MVCLVVVYGGCTNKNPDALLLIGNKFYQQGNLGKAKETYLKITEYTPDFAPAYYNLGIIEEASRQYESAVGYFSQAIERNPMYGQAYVMRGRCYVALNNQKMAENDFQTAQITPETRYDGLAELGRLWVSQRRFTEAIKTLEKCLRIHDTSENVRLTRASAYFETNQYAASLADCNAVLSKNSKRWEAYLLKGKNFLEIPNMDSAFLMLDFARLYSNDNPATLAAISEYYLMNDESAMAIAFADKGLASNPGNIPLKLNKARALDGMEQYEKANLVYNEIADLADSIPEYHFYLSKNMLYIGDTASALVALGDAIGLRKDYSEAYIVRSIIKAKMGDAVGAIEDRERANGNLNWKHPSKKQPVQNLAPSMEPSM